MPNPPSCLRCAAPPLCFCCAVLLLQVTDALIAQGCTLRSCTVTNALVGLRSRLGKGVTVQDALIMGCDYYESDEQVIMQQRERRAVSGCYSLHPPHPAPAQCAHAFLLASYHRYPLLTRACGACLFCPPRTPALPSLLQRAALIAAGKVPLGVGEGTTITNAIVDKNGRIGRNVRISNKAGVQEANREADGFVIRSGIVVVLRNATIKDGLQV